jgi:hypothetical protein
MGCLFMWIFYGWWGRRPDVIALWKDAGCKLNFLCHPDKEKVPWLPFRLMEFEIKNLLDLWQDSNRLVQVGSLA